MRKDINITERNQYRINVKITGVNDITDYIAYGGASHLGCQNHVTQFDCQPSESGFTLTIPSLSAGIHQYEVYAKRISSNVEFLLLEGRIEVKNRLSDGGSISNNNNQIDVDVSLENGEINLAVNVIEGREGPQGEKGDQGEPGPMCEVVFDTSITQNSTNGITSGAVWEFLRGTAAIRIGRGGSVGSYGVSIGDATSATGWRPLAIGVNALAQKDYAAAFGTFAISAGKHSTALGYKSIVKDGECIVLGTATGDDPNYGILTRFYVIGADSALANTYEDGAACLGYVVKDNAGNVLECGTRKLSELLTNNTAFAPASMDLEADPPKPFLPTGATDPEEHHESTEGE